MEQPERDELLIRLDERTRTTASAVGEQADRITDLEHIIAERTGSLAGRAQLQAYIFSLIGVIVAVGAVIVSIVRH